MCGIAGFVTTAAGGDGGHAVAAMQCALAHRGPDDRGAWTSPGRQASFAHTRLAVIDPSPAGRQPMSIDGGRLTITFNGEIYNFMELRRDLERDGARFHSRTDTEVVLHAYDRYGDACVDRLRGMFAFAIWDERERRCLLARDRFGIKPLYYSLRHDGLVFASELRALVASGLVPPAVDARAAYEYFRAGSVQEPRTLLTAVKCLEAGHVASWCAGHFTARRYWALAFNPSVPDADAAAATREALLDSVTHHFVSDVPVGIFLSGGVDSTALLALSHHAGRRDLRALTMAMPGSAGDELALARRTAQHFGARHDVCEVDAESGMRLLTDYLRSMDQPSIDGLNTLAVSRLAQSCGLKAMLSGLGADELFGGYPSVRAIPRFTAWHRRVAMTGPLGRAAGSLFERFPDPRWRRIGDLLNQPPGLATSYAAFRGIFTRAEARRLTHESLGYAPAFDDATDSENNEGTPHDAACRLEMTRYLRNQLLRDADVMSMACGVEIRVPYVDARVVGAVTGIDHRHRLRSRKALLLEAVPEIPEWIARQPKRGFMFPVEAWLGDGWRGTFDMVDVRTAVPTGPWYRKWCIWAFDEWLKRLRATTLHARPSPAAVIVSAHD